MADEGTGELAVLRERIRYNESRIADLHQEQLSHRQFHHEKVDGTVMLAADYFERAAKTEACIEELERRIAVLERTSLSDLALAASKEAVRQSNSELFGLLGKNIADFSKIQEFRDDLDYLENLRAMSSKASSRFFLTLIMMVSGALLLGTWEAVKAFLINLTR